MGKVLSVRKSVIPPHARKLDPVRYLIDNLRNKGIFDARKSLVRNACARENVLSVPVKRGSHFEDTIDIIQELSMQQTATNASVRTTG